MPQISILLPLYRPGQALKAALASIQAQSFQDWELLAVLDGPDPEAQAILEGWGDSRLRRLTLPERGGIVAALNHGLAAAQSSLVARLDHDDRMHPERLSQQWEWAQNLSSRFLLGTQVALEPTQNLTPGRSAFIQRQNAQLTHEAMTLGLYQDSTLSHPSLLTPTAFLRELGGYRNQAWAEDLDLYFRAFLAGAEFAKIPQVLTYKGIHPQQLTKTDPRCKREALFQAKLHFLQLDPRLAHKKFFFLLGTGPSAQKLAEAMQEVDWQGFVDLQPQKHEYLDRPLLPLARLPEIWSEEHLLLVINNHYEVRPAFHQALEALGWTHGKEYLWML